MNKNIIILLVIAALITVYGVGSFLKESEDKYYDYVATYTSTVQAGQPIIYSVRLDGGAALSECDKSGMGIRISPDTAHFCDSFTYFNARSFRVKIDGQDTSNLYYYPKQFTGANLTIQTPMKEIGAVCCYAVTGSCSVCSDQEKNGEQNHRAYFFGVDVAPQKSLNGTTLFTVTIPNNLPPGNHTVEVSYFAETVNAQNDESTPNAFDARLAGHEYGDNNYRFNYYDKFTVNIPGQVIVAPAQTQYTTANASQPAPVNFTAPSSAANVSTAPVGTYIPQLLPSMPQQGEQTQMGIIILVAGAIFVWKFVLGR